MAPVILDLIPFRIDNIELLRQLRLKESSEYAEQVLFLAREAEKLCRPKAMYCAASIEEIGDNYIKAAGVTFTSTILRTNLEHVDRIFPYVATCGREIETWAATLSDSFDSYVGDVIQNMARLSACGALFNQIDKQYQLHNPSNMNPGSLEAWPLTEQQQLFRLFDDYQQQIGVELSKSLLMVPVKTVSGIRFAASEHFANCMLCARQSCPSRKVPYNKAVSVH